LSPETGKTSAKIVDFWQTSTEFWVEALSNSNDLGPGRYNKEVSERPGEDMTDYRTQAGGNPNFFTTPDFGGTEPLGPGTSHEASRGNLRVEIGIIDKKINYQRRVSDSQD